jgi:hypothetical protein
MLNKAVADGPVVHPEQSAGTPKWFLANPAPSSFYSFQLADGPLLRDGRSMLSHGRCSSLLRTVRSRSVEIYTVPVRGVADGPPKEP